MPPAAPVTTAVRPSSCFNGTPKARQGLPSPSTLRGPVGESDAQWNAGCKGGSGTARRQAYPSGAAVHAAAAGVAPSGEPALDRLGVPGYPRRAPGEAVPLAATILLLCLAVLCLVVSHRQDWSTGNLLFKPIASSCLVVLALRGGTEDAYSIGVMAAIGAFWVSDMFLIPHKSRRAFVAGMVAAFAGHACYIGAFLMSGGFTWLTPMTVLALLPALWAVRRWLAPHLTGPMRTAVPAYGLVFAAMVALAVSYAWQISNPAIAIGALVFAVSDLAVARHRFVHKTWRNKVWGLPLYYAGQSLLALSSSG